MKWYVYGLAQPRETHLPEALQGLHGSPVRLEAVGSFEAIVTDFTVGVLKTDRESVLAHERVLQAAMETATPLPFRFGAVLGEERLATFVSQNVDVLQADLARVRGMVQMTARLVVKTPGVETSEPDEGPGTRFLKERRGRREELMEAARWLTENLTDWVRGSEISLTVGRPSMATVAHLVRKPDVESYQARFDQVCRTRADLSAMRSGPWPPYSFISKGKVSQIEA
jgi:hypothetical protein